MHQMRRHIVNTSVHPLFGRLVKMHLHQFVAHTTHGNGAAAGIIHLHGMSGVDDPER